MLKRAKREVEDEHDAGKKRLHAANKVSGYTHSYPHDHTRTLRTVNTKTLRSGALLSETYTPEVFAEFMTRQDELEQNRQEEELEKTRLLARTLKNAADKRVSGFSKHRERLRKSQYVSGKEVFNHPNAPLNVTYHPAKVRSLNIVANRTIGVPRTAPAVHFRHLGVWCYSEIEQCHSWSCCLNDNQSSQGCTRTKVTFPQKWNLASK